MESTIGNDLLRLLAVIVLVLANGFFVAAEFALVSWSPHTKCALCAPLVAARRKTGFSSRDIGQS